MTKKPSFKIKKLFFYGLIICLSLFGLFFVVSCIGIGRSVKDRCRQAQQDYGDVACSQALSSLLQDENRTFAERNSAIWALGQLGNPDSFPVLKSFYTGYIPSHEPTNENISQYELNKAIKLADGGLNLTAIFWRYKIE